MGQFSWLDCKDGSQVVDNRCRDVYVLVPEEFGGGHIKETYYDGYGHFGGKDIYDLVAEWNRKSLSANPDKMFSHGRIGDQPWYPAYADLSLSWKEAADAVPEGAGFFYGEWRVFGIMIACDDCDNASLRYPIKITHDPHAVYENCGPSDRDPDQGWEYGDDDDDTGYW